MKEFLSGLFALTISLIMVIPFHLFRMGVLRIVLKRMGKCVAICRNVEFRCPYRISIGDNTTINKKVLLDGRGGRIVIGNNVDVAQECNIWTLQHDYNSPVYKTVGGDVVIEDYVWLASRCTILPGVKIGYGAVVASCSVVTKDVPPLSVVAGCPAKVIGKRDDCMQYHLGHRHWFM